MRVERIQIAEIERNWHWIYQILSPAVDIDPRRSMQQVKAGLMKGELGLASVHMPKAAGLVIVEPGTFDGVFCCWVPYLAGHVSGGAKDFIRMARQLMAYLELSARLAGCAEMRIGGRDWTRILPDYLPLEGVPNGLRKVL
jgi:hypothetical protein